MIDKSLKEAKPMALKVAGKYFIKFVLQKVYVQQESYEQNSTNEMIYIGSDFPDEYSHSKDTKVLRGPNEYAKANASVAIKELIQIASNKVFSENYKDKHNNKAKYGWYRYDTRFAIPKYDNDGELAGYNVFKGRLVIRHAKDGKLYLYDVLRIKKETSEPLE